MQFLSRIYNPLKGKGTGRRHFWKKLGPLGLLCPAHGVVFFLGSNLGLDSYH